MNRVLAENATAGGNANKEPLTTRVSESLEALKGGNVSEAVHGISDLLVPAIGGLLSLIAAYFVAKLVSRALAALVCRRVDETLGRFTGKLAFYTIIVLALTIVLPIIGIQVSGLMAVLATAGFAVGLAFQGTLSNFASGVLLLVFRPFKVGDTVNVAGIVGRINEIDLFTTTLDTPDNRRLILPNSSIAGSTVENVTFHKHRRVEVAVGVACNASLDQTRAALTAAAESLAESTIQGIGRGYHIKIVELSDSAVRWAVQLWVASNKFAEVRDNLTFEVKRQLDAHRIDPPMSPLRLVRASEAEYQDPAQTPATGESKAKEASNIPPQSLSIPNIHATEERSTRVRPRARGQ